MSIFLNVHTLLGLDWPFSLGNVYTQIYTKLVSTVCKCLNFKCMKRGTAEYSLSVVECFQICTSGAKRNGSTERKTEGDQ